jgi:alkylglycerol monooxygenase
MLWDHVFGTYQHEKERIIYGVVSKHPETFDMITLQFGYYKTVWQKFQSVDGWNNKLSALFKGPGWKPGTPRLGLIADVPEPDPSLPKYSYDPFIPLWHKIYTIAHGFIIFLGFYLFADHHLVVRFSLILDFCECKPIHFLEKFLASNIPRNGLYFILIGCFWGHI